MSEGYTPPLEMTDELTTLVIEIGELAGIISAGGDSAASPMLRRENRIRSIHSSLAIEQNTLSLEQVSDVINGKRVSGPPQDILDEFIHPFADGNGRTGRLWHSLLLRKWRPFFAWLPVETLIRDRQEGYYAAINQSNTEGTSTAFTVFMLKIIRDAMLECSRQDDVGINVGINGARVLDFIREAPNSSARKAADALGLTPRQVERILAKLKKEGKIARRGARKNGYWEVL